MSLAGKSLGQLPHFLLRFRRSREALDAETTGENPPDIAVKNRRPLAKGKDRYRRCR